MWRSNSEGEPIRRHVLADILPMKVPISIDIEASSICCLKCRYCPQSLSNSQKQDINIGNHGVMDFDLFREIVSQIKEFPQKLKNVRFAGFGEPLLNPNIIEMVDYIREADISDTITIFTNGIPLNKEMSRRIANKVDTILFDIQGNGVEDYIKWCGVKIDYDSLIENIQYLHTLNTTGKIFCKTFKSIVQGHEDEFYDRFVDICDEIGIEDLYEIYPEIDYSDMVILEKESTKHEMKASRYCAYPWYQMSIDASGRVTACTLPISKKSDFLYLGNVKDDRLIDIWNGKKLNEIRYRLLTERSLIEECKNCRYTDLTPQEDRIDHIKEKLVMHCMSKECGAKNNE